MARTPEVKPLSDPERIRLIVKALKDCNQEVTPEAVAEQFKRETGRILREVK